LRICTGMEKVSSGCDFSYDAKAWVCDKRHIQLKVRARRWSSPCAKNPERFGGSWPGFIADCVCWRPFAGIPLGGFLPAYVAKNGSQQRFERHPPFAARNM